MVHIDIVVERNISLNMTRLLDDIGERVRLHRTAIGLTQGQLAQKAGMSRRFLGQLEGGKANVSVVRLAELAEALDVSLVSLLSGLGPTDDVDRMAAHFIALSRGAQQELLASVAPVQRDVVALIGLRGAGKSTIGARVADALGRPFVTLDDRVRARSGLQLADLFEMHGTVGYHRHCREALHELVEQGPAVVEVGGSVVADEASWALLERRAVVVWLQAPPRVHLDRVTAQGDTRPMQGFDDALSELESLLRAREPLYRRAHHRVDTHGLGVVGATEAVVEASRDAR